jgi:tetratricopeptide (TPR) repeat protein
MCVKTSFFALILILGLRLSFGQLDRIAAKMEVRDYASALADLEQLAGREENLSIVYFQMGVCHTALGNYPQALDDFLRAKENGLEDAELFASLGMVYFYLGEWPNSRRQFERVLKMRGKDVTAFYYLGRIFLREGRYQEAEQYFLAALAIEPGHDGALFNLGRTLVLQGRSAEGRRLLEFHQKRVHVRDRLKTLRHMAASPTAEAQVFAELANVSLQVGDMEEAVNLLKEAERRGPDTPAIELVRAKIAFYGGHYSDAEDYLLSFIASNHPTCEAYRLLGLAQKQQKKYSSAVRALEKALTICPPDLELLSSLSDLEIRQGRLVRALELAQQVTALNPDSPLGHYLTAVCRLYQKHLREAEVAAIRAEELDSRNPQYHRLLIAIYKKLGDAEKVRQHEAQLQKHLDSGND